VLKEGFFKGGGGGGGGGGCDDETIFCCPAITIEAIHDMRVFLE
jgi:hypothetical protein